MGPRTDAGFTYLAVIFVLAIGSVALGGALNIFSLEARREREIALRFAGNQYRQAIASYYDSTPGASKTYPGALDELLEDRRVAPPLHHLRRLYADPVSGQPWRLVRTAEGTIKGVYSGSAEAPLQRAHFDGADEDFNGKQHYADWKFVYSPYRDRVVPPVFLPTP